MGAKVALIAAGAVLAALGFATANVFVPGAAAHSNPCHSQHTCSSDHHMYVWTTTTVTESTSTTVRFFFKAKATKAVLRFSGAGALMLPAPPAENVLEQATAVQSTVIIHRGVSTATFTVTRARYEFSRRIGILFQEVGLIGQITRSTIRACRVGSPGAIIVDTEENEPSSRTLLRVGSFADNTVVFRICGVRYADPHPVAEIVADEGS